MLDIIYVSKFILTISCNLLTRESLNDNCAPGSGPGVGFTAQMGKLEMKNYSNHTSALCYLKMPGCQVQVQSVLQTIRLFGPLSQVLAVACFAAASKVH